MRPQKEEGLSGLYGLRLALTAVMGLVALSLLPVAMSELSGPDAAGATVGFSEPLQHFSHVILFFLTGFAASRLGKQAVIMLPVSFLLMLGLGALTDISMAQHPYARVCLFAFVLLYAVAVSAAYSMAFLMAAAVTSAIAYYFGTLYMLQAPDVASLGYYMLGCQISVALVLACGMSLGVATQGYTLSGLERIKRTQLVGALRHFLW